MMICILCPPEFCSTTVEFDMKEFECSVCKGNGRVEMLEHCSNCGGTGDRRSRRELYETVIALEKENARLLELLEGKAYPD